MTQSLDLAYLEQLKAEHGLTMQQISEISGVPIGTCKRIFSKQTECPNGVAVASIVVALGGSMDDAFGIIKVDDIMKKEPPKEDGSNLVLNGSNLSQNEIFEKALASARSSYQNAYDSIKATHQSEMDTLKQTIKDKNRWIKAMFIYSVLLTIVFAAELLLRK